MACRAIGRLCQQCHSNGRAKFMQYLCSNQCSTHEQCSGKNPKWPRFNQGYAGQAKPQSIS